MKILHVLGTTDLGGAESRIMDLYRNMDRQQVQFDFLVHMNPKTYRAALKAGVTPESLRKPGYFDSEITALGGHIYALPAFRIYNLWTYKRAVKRFFREHKGTYDVVHGHMTSTASIYLPIAKKMGVPVTIAHARSAGVDRGIKGCLTRWLRKDLWKRADYLFTCSQLAAQAVFGRPAIFIPNAINTGEFAFDETKRTEIRNKFGVSKDTFLVGHVGRFHYAKNHEYLLQAFAVFHKRVSDSCLLLLGDGPKLEEMKALAGELGIEQAVIFAGNQKDPGPCYSAMDMFVFPSRFEGLPGTVVEAQASGLPCILSDAIAEETKVTDLVTWKSIAEDPQNWAEYMENSYQMQKHPSPDDGRQGSENREKYATLVAEAGFDVKVQADRLKKLYGEYLKKNGFKS